MDWALVIRRKRADMVAVLAELLALAAVGLSGERGLAVLRLLRPAESALRRVIFIMARQIAPRAARVRGLPDFSTFGASAPDRVAAFRLADPRKRFDMADGPGDGGCRPEPKIRMIGLDAFGTMGGWPPVPDTSCHAPRPVAALAIVRRIAAFRAAVEDLPRQARRMARLMARHTPQERSLERARLFRPGLPPGLAACNVSSAALRPPWPGDMAALLIDCEMLARHCAQAPP